jgi:hypothetical protein
VKTRIRLRKTLISCREKSHVAINLGSARHIAALTLPAESEAGPDPYALKSNPWVEFGGLGADDDASRGIIEFWSPLMQSPTALFFFDGKFQFIEDSVQEGNDAFGASPI